MHKPSLVTYHNQIIKLDKQGKHDEVRHAPTTLQDVPASTSPSLEKNTRRGYTA